MWRLTIKGLLAHKLRLALTGLAIVLGVTFVSGTLVLTDTLHNTFTGLFDTVYQHVDLEIRGTAAFSSQSGGPAIRKSFSQSLISQVGAVPGVAVASGGVGGYAQYVAKNGKAITTGGAPTIGMAYEQNRQLSSLKLAEGSGPKSASQVVMDQGTTKKYGFHVGDQVRILLPGAPQTFTISGIVRFGSANNLAGATIAAFNLPTAQRLFDKVGQLDTIDIIVASGAKTSVVEHAVASILPRGVEVVTGQTVANEDTSSINQALGFFSTALLVFAFIALFVGAFTIFNTFSITVGQRTRELALLRIVGASRRQIFRSVLLEALLLGLAASIVGLGLGVLTAMGLDALLKAFGISLPSGSLVFATRTVVAALVVGVGVTVLSAINPARQAVRIPPIAALASYQKGSVESSRRRFAIGGAVGIMGVLVLVVGVAKPAIQLVGLGAMAIFLGVGMLAPLVARPISSALGRPLAAIFGISGKLGRENSIRSPRRTAQTASALMVGLALVSTFSVFGASISRSATSGINEAIVADYVITNPSVGGPQAGFSATAATAAARVSGVTTVTRVDGGMFEIGQSVRTIVAISPNDLSTTVVLRMASGTAASSLSHGELLIDTTTANNKHLKVGERIRATFSETGPTMVRVGGVFKPNALLGSYVVGNTFFRSHFAVNTLPVALLLSTSRGSSAEATAAITGALKSYPNLKIQTRAQFIKAQQAQVNELLGLVYALLALAILVALIGIVNTLMLSVFERTREIGLLRAVGMRRRQVRAMIRSEAVILSVFGALIGVVVGTGLGVALASSLTQQGITDIAVPYTSLAVFVVFAALLGFAAAAWPARRAARLEVLDAIAVE